MGILIVVAFLAGAAEYEPCNGPTDCPAGDDCIKDVGSTNNVCRLPCTPTTQCPATTGGVDACNTTDNHCYIGCDTTTTGCPAGFACNASKGACGFLDVGEGEGEGGATCTCDGDCATGTVCLDGACEPSCTKSSECGQGFACVLGTGTGACARVHPTQFPDAAICTASGDCTDGRCNIAFHLAAQICSVSCTADTDCSGGLVCGPDKTCVRSGVCPKKPGDDATTKPSSCASSGATATFAGLALVLGLLRRRRR